MGKNKNYSCSNNRIKNIGTAIFSNTSESVWRFPICLVKEIDMDSLGNIYFSVANRYPDMTNIERTFSSRLRLFNRKKNYYLEVVGEATTTLLPSEVQIKLQVSGGQLFSIRNKSAISFCQRLLSRIKELLNSRIILPNLRVSSI